jgi:membrane protein DedA with SNARE-associated domain
MRFDLQALADSIGYPAAGLGILVESAGIPFPGETTLLAVAAYAAAGHLDIRVVVVVAALGAIVGGDFGYLVGHRGGRPFVERFSRLLHVNSSHLARSEMFFTRYGGTAIVFARFVLGLRTWASVLAGMAHMPFWSFQLYSAVGGILWAVVIGCVGFYLGSNWAFVQALVRDLGLGGLAVLVAVILAVLLLRRRASHT